MIYPGVRRNPVHAEARMLSRRRTVLRRNAISMKIGSCCSRVVAAGFRLQMIPEQLVWYRNQEVSRSRADNRFKRNSKPDSDLRKDAAAGIARLRVAGVCQTKSRHRCWNAKAHGTRDRDARKIRPPASHRTLGACRRETVPTPTRAPAITGGAFWRGAGKALPAASTLSRQHAGICEILLTK